MHFPMAARHINRGDSRLATAVLVASTTGHGCFLLVHYNVQAPVQAKGSCSICKHQNGVVEASRPRQCVTTSVRNEELHYRNVAFCS